MTFCFQEAIEISSKEKKRQHSATSSMDLITSASLVFQLKKENDSVTMGNGDIVSKHVSSRHAFD